MGNKVQPLDRDRDQPLPSSITPQGVQVERVQQWVKGKKVILLHLVGPIPPRISPGSLYQLALGNPEEYKEAGFILRTPGDPWSSLGQEVTTEYNCHAYSLGERVGIFPGDWVEGEPTDLSMNTNPMQILLSAYFKPVGLMDASGDNVKALASDKNLRDNDVISFTYDRDYWGTVHDHSGRVMLVNGENWIASKVREGRLVVTPILENFTFCTRARKIRIYRFRG